MSPPFYLLFLRLMLIRNVLGIEEKFDMVIDNYLEYEHDLLDLALAHMASHDVNWSSFHDAMNLVNRRLANCLTVSWLYVDQAKHDLSGVYGKNAETTTRVRQAFSAQYDRLLGYRVMEALRNSLQHRSLPVKSLSYVNAWESRKNGELLHHRVVAQLHLEELRDDKEMKRSVLEELEQSTKGTHDITLSLRQYVEGLSCAHQEFRKATSGDIEPWKNTLLEIIQRYSEACAENIGIIIVYQLDDEDTTVDEFPVFRDGIDRLERLRTKQLPTNISRWYVSNEQP
jgi:hypothetical protein